MLGQLRCEFSQNRPSDIQMVSSSRIRKLHRTYSNLAPGDPNEHIRLQKTLNLPHIIHNISAAPVYHVSIPIHDNLLTMHPSELWPASTKAQGHRPQAEGWGVTATACMILELEQLVTLAFWTGASVTTRGIVTKPDNSTGWTKLGRMTDWSNGNRR